MLWRPAHQTHVARDVNLPKQDLETEILVGGFNFAALRNMSIWRRLAVADAPNHSYLEVIILPDPQPADQRMLETIVPASSLASTVLTRDEEGAWHQLIQPVDNEECFAAVIREDHASIMMKGIPTEEAWDAFLDALRA
jgi:hypothetical protein